MKNILTNTTKTAYKGIIFGTFFGLTVFSVAYAASIIDSTTDPTVSSGDSITANWYQDVNDKLGGISVSGGEVNMNKVKVEGITPQIIFTDTDSNGDSLIFSDGGTNAGSLFISADHNNELANSKMEFRVDGKKLHSIEANGDIAFFEDTGSNAKMMWDASTERLGIGTTTPGAKLSVSGIDHSSSFVAEDPIFEIKGAAGARKAEWIHSTKASVSPTETPMIHWYGWELPAGRSIAGSVGFLDVSVHITGTHAAGAYIKQFKILHPNKHEQQESGGLQSAYVDEVYSLEVDGSYYGTDLQVQFYYLNTGANRTGKLYAKVTSKSREPILTIHSSYIGGTGYNNDKYQRFFYLGSSSSASTYAPSNITELVIH